MRPQPRDNELVEAQRSGFCVWHSLHGFLGARGVIVWGAAAKAYVFADRADALRAANMLAAQVTTVPRFNGHVHEWEVL